MSLTRWPLLRRASSGFKLYIEGLTSLTLNIGETTTSPAALAGLSIDYAPFITVNISTGANVLPITGGKTKKTSVIEIATEGWQDNRIQLESLVLNMVRHMGCCRRLPSLC